MSLQTHHAPPGAWPWAIMYFQIAHAAFQVAGVHGLRQVLFVGIGSSRQAGPEPFEHLQQLEHGVTFEREGDVIIVRVNP